ncbi:MAG TPA: biotin/lipoyl-containing protein [Candidatus Thermoplasmatota archaeon]|nr:biotin/lipoyl-containing protein [Candidatus Thermoplasmatota archaeon]
MTQVRIALGGEPLQATVQRKGDRVLVELEGQTFSFQVTGEGARRRVTGEGGSWDVERRGLAVRVDGEEAGLRVLDVAATVGAAAAGGAATRIRPPMTGRLESLRVAVGQAVQKGDVLFVLEAMKMLNEVRAPMAGTVTAIHAQPGAAVETGQAILDLGPPA